MKSFSDNLSDLSDRAEDNFYQGNLSPAQQLFDHLLDLDPDWAQGYWYLAQIYEKKNLKEKAEELYARYLDYGKTEHNYRDFDTALRIFNDLILMKPLTAELYGCREFTHYELDEQDRALRDKQMRDSINNDSTGRGRDIFLFLDTETSGLPKNYNAPMSDLQNWPRLIQLAIILSDDQGNLIYEDDFIIKPEGFSIPQEASNVHGITDQIALTRGINLKYALQRLIDTSRYVDYIVGHNIEFDMNILGAEFLRYGKYQNPLIQPQKICTMKSTTNYCRIQSPYGLKWPSLEELYNKVFEREIQFAHNAKIDAQATFLCFWKLKKEGIIHVPLP